MTEFNSKSEMKRIAMTDPQKAADELMRLRAENERLKYALEQFKIARVMAGPEDVSAYISNHETAHRCARKALGHE